ncbi:uncharacterized protein LOC130693620 isoform X2 [Daphnia carinata]|uniref:uncharacterized protein LOC130693620 isoform X2 n=1 Tax=Daphnia carinata TaxID=120202 RepID=UPI00257F1FA1|nr:uncharacterized protein LOC130693620 isoform X2 [Daphnia carinata]
MIFSNVKGKESSNFLCVIRNPGHMARRKRSIGSVEKELVQPALNHRQTRESTRRKKSFQTARFSNYVFKVLKQVHPQLSMTNKAMKVMDDFMHDIYSRLVAEAAGLVKLTRRSTLSASEFQTATRLILPGELAKHAISEASKAVANFLTSRDDDAKRSHARRVINNPPSTTSAGASNQEPVEIEIFGTGRRPPVSVDTESIEEDEFVKQINPTRKFYPVYPSKDNQIEQMKIIQNASKNIPDSSTALHPIDEEREMSEENITDEENGSTVLGEPGPPTPPTEVESDTSITTTETPPVDVESDASTTTSKTPPIALESDASTTKPDIFDKSEIGDANEPKHPDDEANKKRDKEADTLEMDAQSVDSEEAELLVVVNVKGKVCRNPTHVLPGSTITAQMTSSSDTMHSIDTESQRVSVSVDTGRPPHVENEAVVSGTSSSTNSDAAEAQPQLTVRCSTVTSTKTTLIHERKEKVSEWFTG